MPELALGLLGGHVVSVVHVLVLAQVGGDLSDLRVELHVQLLLLAEHDGVLRTHGGTRQSGSSGAEAASAETCLADGRS